ncbi:MAG: hypothetical protein JKX81_07680 [Arenicella sp.]|nr:hypothetical protein [Arenicella sp.]
MQNAHEYQDALEFTTIATVIVDEVDNGSAELNTAKASARSVNDRVERNLPCAPLKWGRYQ